VNFEPLKMPRGSAPIVALMILMSLRAGDEAADRQADDRDVLQRHPQGDQARLP
jgi:hypothetical protein